jgi:hypothetical protein
MGITIYAGHYGSGKTTLAVSKALSLREKFPCEKVALADLDIVNPYFRAADSKKLLDEKGIALIASQFANTNLEAPAMPGETASLFDSPEIHGVIDVGGDDRGAYALGRYAGLIEKSDYEMVLVCNRYRPLSRTPRQALETMREIEAASHVRFTGVAGNSNLGQETTAQDILDSLPYIHEVSSLSGLPVSAVCAASRLMDEVRRLIGAEAGFELIGVEPLAIEKWRI